MANNTRNRRSAGLDENAGLKQKGRKRGGLLAKIVLYAVIEMGAMMGVPVRPEEIEQLTRSINGTVVSVEQEQEQDGE